MLNLDQVLTMILITIFCALFLGANKVGDVPSFGGVPFPSFNGSFLLLLIVVIHW